MAAGVYLTGEGLLPGQKTLTSAKVIHYIASNTWVVNGIVGAITATGISNWQLDVNDSSDGLRPGSVATLDLGPVYGSDINVEGPITTLKIYEWRETGSGDDLTRGSLTAERITYFKVLGKPRWGIYGHCSVDVTLTGNGADPTLQEVIVKGTVYDSTWNVTGSVNTVTTAAAEDWNLNVHSSVQTLNLGSVTGSHFSVDGPITTFKALQWLPGDGGNGSLAAERVTYFRIVGKRIWAIAGDCTADLTLTGNGADPTIYTAFIKGALLDSEWTMAGTLRLLDVTTWIADTDIRVAGDITTAYTGALARSRVFAGVFDTVTDMPDSLGDFSGEFAIGNFTIEGIATVIRNSYLGTIVGLTDHLVQDSCIAAWHLGTVKLKQVRTDNADPYPSDGVDPVFTDFGVTFAGAVPNIVWHQDGLTLKWPTNWLPNTNDFQIVQV
jgi:hypothetical protein